MIVAGEGCFSGSQWCGAGTRKTLLSADGGTTFTELADFPADREASLQQESFIARTTHHVSALLLLSALLTERLVRPNINRKRCSCNEPHNLQAFREETCGVFLNDTAFMVIGGRYVVGNNQEKPETYIYDITGDTWSSGPLFSIIVTLTFA